MSDPAELRAVLDGALRRQEAALLKLSRHVTRLLEKFGAYAVRKDWSTATYEIALEVADRWGEKGVRLEPTPHLETIVKNRFWGLMLDLMTENNPNAANLFFPTVRRLLAKWDPYRKHEASWDDVVQDTAQQLWEKWLAGDVQKPWAMLCTIARRRFLDRVRAAKPTEEIDEEQGHGGEDEREQAPELFASEALAILEEKEREVIVKMDLEGWTRVEIAAHLEMTEGQVLSVRRAGLRRIWRWLGRDLPPRLREVWEEMFKGAKRLTPEQVAVKCGLSRQEVAEILREARELTGLV
jgi:RNA polymerase sigma factor (sigma-70 family)